MSNDKVRVTVGDDGSVYVDGELRYDADDVEAMVYDSVCPTICKFCGEDGGEDCEPDAVNYRCGSCGQRGQTSVLVLAGLI